MRVCIKIDFCKRTVNLKNGYDYEDKKVAGSGIALIK